MTRHTVIAVVPYIPLLVSVTLLCAIVLGERRANAGDQITGRLLGYRVEEKLTRAATRARLREKPLYTPVLTVSVPIKGIEQKVEINSSRELMFYSRKDAERFLASFVEGQSVPLLMTGSSGEESFELLTTISERKQRARAFQLLALLIALPSVIWLLLRGVLPKPS